MNRRVSESNNPYVSRGGLKLESVAQALHLVFKNKTVLDVGSSTGGFTDFALQHGAIKVIAVDSGTNQLHASLVNNPQVELHEKTDIRSWILDLRSSKFQALRSEISIILIDVSFVSLREILPRIKQLADPNTAIVAMVKPQFEASEDQKNKGVIKNERIRRQILKDFENWAQKLFKLENKVDSKLTGDKGNLERFYVLKSL